MTFEAYLSTLCSEEKTLLARGKGDMLTEQTGVTAKLLVFVRNYLRLNLGRDIGFPD
jgi:hypothetical protein